MTLGDTQLIAWHDSVRRQPEHFGVVQRQWSRCFGEAVERPSANSEFELVLASFPACFDVQGWYEYFGERVLALLSSQGLNEIGSDRIKELQLIARRYAAFGGQFRVNRIDQPEARRASKRGERTIGIDIRPLSIPSSRKRGIGRYLMSTLPLIARMASKHRLVLFGDTGTALDDELNRAISSPNASYRELGLGCDFDLDVFLVTDPLPMLTGRKLSDIPVTRCPWMSIVYDFIPLEFPELYLRGSNLLTDEYLDNVETLARRSVRVFPISNYVASQCESILGLPESRITPVFGGVDASFHRKSNAAAAANREYPYFLYVGGGDARKNIRGLVEAFAEAKPHLPADTQLLLVGEMTSEKTAAVLRHLNLSSICNDVVGLGAVEDERLLDLYSGALATVFVSYSEGLGLPALEAMACGCPVLASKTTALGETVGDAALVVDPSSRSEIVQGMIALANDNRLRQDFISRGKARALKWRWEDVAAGILDGLTKTSPLATVAHASPRKLRVAMLNRDNVWNAPGGDSHIMRQMQSAAAARDIDVLFPTTKEQTQSADIIHLVNMTLPGPLNHATRLAEESGIPLVITTLFEDWPLYLEASHQAFAAYRAVLEGRLAFSEMQSALDKIAVTRSVSGPQTTVQLAKARLLFACAESEALRLSSAFPDCAGKIRVLPFEVTVPTPAEPKTTEALRKSLGFDEFVLCIGRMETRKNQLALLAALSEVDIPIVFATGGYTPQPGYAAAVRAWKRKAPVKFVERMPWYLMSALIRSASAHALPSFYELPGLVHLECAAAGIPVVATDWGALSDYLPESMYHKCDPLDLDSIRDSVEQALARPFAPAVSSIALSYTKEQLAGRLQLAYEEALTPDNVKLTKHIHSVHRPQQPKVSGGIHAAV